METITKHKFEKPLYIFLIVLSLIFSIASIMLEGTMKYLFFLAIIFIHYLFFKEEIHQYGIKKISIIVISVAAYLLFMGSAIMYTHKHKHAKIKEAYINSLEQQQITD